MDVNSWHHFPVYKTSYGEELYITKIDTHFRKEKVPTGMIEHTLNKWCVSGNQNWA
jgi:hypothetical protein